LQTAPQNFLVRNSFPRPAFEHAIDPDALRALEFFVIEIGVVNHFPNFVRGFVLDPKSFQQRFKRTIFSVMREFSVKHVERNGATIRRDRFRKDKLRLGIDEFSDQPGGPGAIDLRAWTRDPGSAAVISRRNF
jgi:hypothetical protein